METRENSAEGKSRKGIELRQRAVSMYAAKNRSISLGIYRNTVRGR